MEQLKCVILLFKYSTCKTKKRCDKLLFYKKYPFFFKNIWKAIIGNFGWSGLNEKEKGLK